MESEIKTAVNNGERPATSWQKHTQESGSLQSAFDRPPTSVPRLHSRVERPISRRGLKKDIQDSSLVSSTSHAGIPGRTFQSRPLSASISSSRVSTASSRMTRLNTGLSANSFTTNASSIDRPVTQQGIAAVRPNSTRGLPRMTRQIQDKRYYEGLMQLKIRELTQEIMVISREIEMQNKERVTFLHYDQRAKDLAAELTDLQCQLADYNIVIDKMASDTDNIIIEQEAKELSRSNDATLTEIEELFEKRQHKDKHMRTIEESIALERKNAEKIVENMNQDAREKYDKLIYHKTKLQEMIDKIQQQSVSLSIEKMTLEGRIALSQVKQEAVRLQTKIIELTEKRAKLFEEDRNKLLPEVEKDRILQKVKQDNVDIAASERRIFEIEKRTVEVEQELEQIEINIDEDLSEKLVKYKELRKREEAMEDFMANFEENKVEELEKMKKMEATIVDYLENISSEMDGEFRLSNNHELSIFNFQHDEIQKEGQGFDGLRQEHIRLRKMLTKIKNLDEKLKTELKVVAGKIEKYQSELVILEDLGGLKSKSKAKCEELLGQREQLKIQQPACDRKLEIVQMEFNEIENRLNGSEIYLQINALESKLKKLKENNITMQTSIIEKNERMNYLPIKEHSFSLRARYNSLLTDSINKSIY